MAFTNQELRDIYTDLNIGSPGPAVDQAAVDAIAAQTRAGLISEEQALQAVYDLVDDTTGVAALTYQFFTGSLPSEGGFQFLVNSATNANDLNDPYYTQFNAENRFINFSFNLALGTPANQAAFAAVYGAASLEDTIRVAYDTIVGNAAAEAAGIDVEDAIDFLTGPDQVAFYRAIALSRGGVAASDTVRLDLAIKAIAIAELLYAAASEDVGNYASALNQFYASLIDETAGSPGFNNDLLETFPPTATVTLTEGPDTLTGNVFNAPRGFTPGGTDQVNTLNDDDVLNGVGDNPTLNFTFVNDADTGDQSIAPTLNGIETINVDVRTNGGLTGAATLDLQDATGVTNINVEGIDDGLTFTLDNIQSIVDGSISDSNAASATVDFAFDEDAVEGDADASTLTLDEVELEDIFYQEEGGAIVDEGIEDLTIVLEGENDVGNIWVEEAEIITLTGEGSLDLGVEDNVRNSKGNIEAMVRSGGFKNVAGSLVEIDASAMEGDLNINLGDEVVANLDDTSGTPVDFVFKGGKGDDQVWLLGGVDSDDDKIDTGAGDDIIGVYASVTDGTITNAESLLVHSGVDGLAPLITVDTGLFTGLEDVTVRNIGHGPDVLPLPLGDGDLDPTAILTVVELDNLSAAVAQEITVQHGTTGNNAINSLTVDTTFKAPTTNDTVGVTIANGVNLDARFNFTLGAASAENVTIHDEDTESNSVLLTNAVGHTGTITLDGGQKGNFLNLDVTGNLYRYDLSGGTTDGGVQDIGTDPAERFDTKVINAADHIGNVVVRVGAGVGPEGAQTVTMGAGDDTVIYDALNNTTAGYSVNDTVSGGDGKDTLVLDGDGVQIEISDSEWTNTTGFETIRLVGNNVIDDTTEFGTNAYNLALTNDLIDQNGYAVGNGRVINIVNDNGAGGDTGETGVTIDATTLDAKHTFYYDGEEGVLADITADRFIMSDANLNGTTKIDGGAVLTALGAGTNTANLDILEIRNQAVVTLGDLAGIQNVSKIEVTNSEATDQTITMTLNTAAIDRLVNSSKAASAISPETLTIAVFDNPDLATAQTGLNIDLTQVDFMTTSVALDFTKASGDDIVELTATPAGADRSILVGAGNDTIAYVGGTKTAAIDLAADTADFDDGFGNQSKDTITGAENVDLSGYTVPATGTLTVTADGGADGSDITLAIGQTKVTLGAGTDTIIVNSTNAAVSADGSGLDQITGFATGADDVEFGGPAGIAGNFTEVAAVYGSYALMLADVNSAGGAATIGGAIRYVVAQTGADTYVFYDRNGDGTADSVVQLMGIGVGAFDAVTDIT